MLATTAGKTSAVTDVTRRPFAFDVLFAGLQGHAQGGLATDVLRGPPMMRPGTCRWYSGRVAKKAACGPPYPHWHAKALRAPDGRIGSKFPRGPQQTQGEQINRHAHQRLMSVSLSAEGGVVV